jgi:uncharacterized protein YdeI (YjbR/CyaY-like superfamily)
MEIGKTLFVTQRSEWRKWLSENHKSEKEIWLIGYRKATGKLSLPYNDAVEEALCFGWIDSTVKKLDAERNAQRYTPRRPNSSFSEMNKERVRRLIIAGLMTPSGLVVVGDLWTENFTIADDILQALKANAQVWQNFNSFPESYRRIRVGWIEGARKRPADFEKRLKYFIKMTAVNKQFGMLK